MVRLDSRARGPHVDSRTRKPVDSRTSKVKPEVEDKKSDTNNSITIKGEPNE